MGLILVALLGDVPTLFICSDISLLNYLADITHHTWSMSPKPRRNRHEIRTKEQHEVLGRRRKNSSVSFAIAYEPVSTIQVAGSSAIHSSNTTCIQYFKFLIQNTKETIIGLRLGLSSLKENFSGIF